MFGFIKNLWSGNIVKGTNNSSGETDSKYGRRIRESKYNLRNNIESKLGSNQSTRSVQKTNSDITKPNKNEYNDILNDFEIIENTGAFGKTANSKKSEKSNDFEIIGSSDFADETTDDSSENSDSVVIEKQNSDVNGYEGHVDKGSEGRVKDFLDTNKYSEDDPKTMDINGIQMSKIKVGDNVYVLPKGMYEKSNVDAEEAAKRIDFGKQIYEEIKDNKNKEKNDFVVVDELSKADVSNLIWFLEYKACRKNNKYSSNSSNMRIPDNDGKIYDAIYMALNKDKNDATGGIYGRGSKWMFGLIDESSHFNTENAKTIKQSQVGLDFEFGELPFGKRTILLAHGNPDGAENIAKGTYIKLEDVGINGGIADTLEHGLNYFKSKGKVIQHDEDFREKLVCSKELSKYGKTMSEIYLKAENGKIKGKELEMVEKLLVEEGILSEREKLLDREDLKIRLGRELILEDKDLQ